MPLWLDCFHSVSFEHLCVSEHRGLPGSAVGGLLSVHGVLYSPSLLLKGIRVVSSVWLAITMLPEPLHIPHA